MKPTQTTWDTSSGASSLLVFMQEMEAEVRAAIRTIGDYSVEGFEESVARQATLCLQAHAALSQLRELPREAYSNEVQCAARSLATLTTTYSLLLQQVRVTGQYLLAVQSNTMTQAGHSLLTFTGSTCSVEA